MTCLMRLAIAVCILGSIVCPPVKEQKGKPREKQDPDDKPLGLQYERYLKEVVNILEEDEGFRQKLERSNMSEIKSGDIAQHLEFVSHKVRSQLDELKRKEVERLNVIKKVMTLKADAGDGERPALRDNLKLGLKPLPDIGVDENNIHKFDKHVDMKNPQSFEVEDLKKLIVQATSDLEEMDKKRRDEFKNYEMEKEALRREKLKAMTDRERKEAEEKFKEQQKKHKDHPKVNHPGSKDQLEEVWEEGDGMDREDFDPRTFFFMHDTNGDGVLDYVEIEALFQRELDKVYDEDATEDDMMERYEEMSRMREHVYKEVDKNRDGLISLEEFMQSARDPNFDEKEEWDTLDDEEIYTEEELQQFENEMRERMRQRAFEGQAQPGEIHIPDDHSPIPPVHDNLGGIQQDNVDQMHQQFKQEQFQQQNQQQFQQPPQDAQQQQHPDTLQFQQHQQDQQFDQQEQAIDPELQQQHEEEAKLRLLQEQQEQRQHEFEQNQQQQQQQDDAPPELAHLNEQVVDNQENNQIQEQNDIDHNADQQQFAEEAQHLDQQQENVEHQEPVVADVGQ